MYRENRFGGGERRSFAPVRVGEEVDVKIEAVGEKGDGIAKIKGFVIFVPNVKQGDEVKVKITKVLRKVGFGEVVSGSSSTHSRKSRANESDESSQTDSGEDTESKDETQEDMGSQDSQEDTDSGEADSEDFGEEDSQQEEY